MYDLVNIIVPIDFDTPVYFDKHIEITDSDTGEFKETRGRLKNLIIKRKRNTIIIIGSIAKYYFGNNLDMLSLKSTEEALKKLSDELKVPFEKAYVTRLEFGANLILEYPIYLYLECLLSKRKYIKRTYPDTVQFTQTIKALSFYDKLEELKINKENINVLRYEIKLHKQIGKILKWGKVKVSDLYDPIFYKMLKKRWLNEYKTISKKKKLLIIKRESITNLKHLKNTLCSIAIHFYGIHKMMQLINSLNGAVSKQTKYNLNEAIYKFSKNSSLFEEVELIRDLNKKIREIAESDEL